MTNSRIAVRDNRFIDFQMKNNSISIGFCCSPLATRACGSAVRLWRDRCSPLAGLEMPFEKQIGRRAERISQKGNKIINEVQRARSSREEITEALRERCVSKEIEIHTSMLIYQNKLTDDEHTQVVPRPFYHSPFAVRRRPLFFKYFFVPRLTINKQRNAKCKDFVALGAD